MAYNFNKQGYSLYEVAQILHCSYSTTIRLVDSGDLKAVIQDKLTDGGRRRIRVTKDQLVDYMKNHKDEIPLETLKAFHVFESPKEEKVCERSFLKECTTEPCGAWTSTYKEEPESIEIERKKDVTKDTDNKICSILVDGRICVSNISLETAKVILNALLQDTNIKMKSITLEFCK